MNAYSLRFQTRRIAPSLLTAAFLLLLPLAGATSVRAQDTAPPVAANPSDTPSIDSMGTIFDLRDAPVRQGLEMLFAAGHTQFSVDNAVSGFITMKTSEQSLRKDLRRLCSTSAQSLTYRTEKNVFYVSGETVPVQAVQSYQIVRRGRRGAPVADPAAAPESAPVAAPVAAPIPTPSSVTDVPRRVAGVLILKSGAAYAILETGAPNGPATRVSVVEYKTESTSQNPMHVSSGFAGAPDLIVTGIDATGITLTGSGGAAIHVPLKASATP